MSLATFAVTTRDHVFVYVLGRLVMKTYRRKPQRAHVWHTGR